MKAKKASGGFREDSDSFKGNRKRKLTPVKKQKSKKTQFFDAIEEDEFEDNEFGLRDREIEELYEDIEDLEDLEAIDDLEDIDLDDMDEEDEF
jgi:hypothetical protein